VDANPTSVVIVRCPKGWTAHIGYDDNRKNVWMSHAVKEQLHRMVARYFK